VPEYVSLEDIIPFIRRLLLVELKETDALLFDVRDNPGGYVYFAQALVQLFKGTSKHVKYRLVKNSIHDELISQYEDPESE
jgi:C-terminal processing protease CtpA/Prc